MNNTEPLPGIKSEVLHVRIDPEMHEALKIKAKEYGAGVTTIVRIILRAQLRKEKMIK